MPEDLDHLALLNEGASVRDATDSWLPKSRGDYANDAWLAAHDFLGSESSRISEGAASTPAHHTSKGTRMSKVTRYAGTDTDFDQDTVPEQEAEYTTDTAALRAAMREERYRPQCLLALNGVGPRLHHCRDCDALIAATHAPVRTPGRGWTHASFDYDSHSVSDYGTVPDDLAA